MGEKIRVEMAHRFSRDRFASGRGGGFRGRHNGDRGFDRSGFRHGGSGHGRWERRRPVNPPRRSRYRLLVENLSSAISWRYSEHGKRRNSVVECRSTLEKQEDRIPVRGAEPMIYNKRGRQSARFGVETVVKYLYLVFFVEFSSQHAHKLDIAEITD
ncbi:hypothetical protein T10_3249 [Trichinella papuae]|uniref:Uncharacterized protein n=1 Tax=Trichinella papuae TaxID=268474 RepID=A0A0V1MVS7_9BILA|nr:hypothetical protein T10_3249 [Trichinella papuae]